MPLIDPRLLEAMMAPPNVGLLSNVGDVINSKDRFLNRDKLTEGARPNIGGGGAQIHEVPSLPEIGSRNWVNASQPRMSASDRARFAADATTGESLAKEGLAWQRADPRGRDPTHNPEIYSRFQKLPIGEQQRFSQIIKDKTFEAMDKPRDWTSEPAPMSRMEAIKSQRETATDPFKGMDENSWNNMTAKQREQWLQNLKDFKGWDRLGQSLDELKPVDTVHLPPKMSAKQQAWDDRWAEFGRSVGVKDPSKIGRITEALKAEAAKNGLDMSESQLKYWVSVFKQKGEL